MDKILGSDALETPKTSWIQSLTDYSIGKIQSISTTLHSENLEPSTYSITQRRIHSLLDATNKALLT